MKPRNNKVLFSAYITEECAELMEYLSAREDLTIVAFIKKAVEYFLQGNQIVDERILITKRTAKGYIKRHTLISGYIDPNQKGKLEEIGKSQGANFSQVLFQCLVNYCALLITIDDSGIVIDKK